MLCENMFALGDYLFHVALIINLPYTNGHQGSVFFCPEPCLFRPVGIENGPLHKVAWIRGTTTSGRDANLAQKVLLRQAWLKVGAKSQLPAFWYKDEFTRRCFY